MNTTTTDYRMEEPTAWPDDITYCRSNCGTPCYRHVSHLPGGLRYFSMADMWTVCASYTDGGQEDEED